MWLIFVFNHIKPAPQCVTISNMNEWTLYYFNRLKYYIAYA